MRTNTIKLQDRLDMFLNFQETRPHPSLEQAILKGRAYRVLSEAEGDALLVAVKADERNDNILDPAAWRTWAEALLQSVVVPTDDSLMTRLRGYLAALVSDLDEPNLFSTPWEIASDARSRGDITEAEYQAINDIDPDPATYRNVPRGQYMLRWCQWVERVVLGIDKQVNML